MYSTIHPNIKICCYERYFKNMHGGEGLKNNSLYNLKPTMVLIYVSKCNKLCYLKTNIALSVNLHLI